MERKSDKRNVLATQQFGINKGFRFKLIHPGESKVVQQGEIMGDEFSLSVKVPEDKGKNPRFVISNKKTREKREAAEIKKRTEVRPVKKQSKWRTEVVPQGKEQKFRLIGEEIAQPAVSAEGLAEEMGLINRMSPFTE